MLDLIKNRHIEFFSNPALRFSSTVALVALILSTFINYYAGTYATESVSNPVTDIILSNTPVFNVDAVFVYGSLVLALFIAGILLTNPKQIPFTLHALTLFILIRSAFISFTHIAPYPEHAILDLGTVANKFIFGGDLFFSGHTGIPFLMALIFWNNKTLRYVFIAWSIIFGVTALMGHLHYTIDVLSAFFITYTIFHIAMFLFKKEKRLFDKAEKTI